MGPSSRPRTIAGTACSSPARCRSLVRAAGSVGAAVASAASPSCRTSAMEPYFVMATCCPCADGDVGARAGVTRCSSPVFEPGAGGVRVGARVGARVGDVDLLRLGADGGPGDPGVGGGRVGVRVRAPVGDGGPSRGWSSSSTSSWRTGWSTSSIHSGSRSSASCASGSIAPACSAATRRSASEVRQKLRADQPPPSLALLRRCSIHWMCARHSTIRHFAFSLTTTRS